MIVLGIIFCAFGIGFLCWLLFELAVYALPSFAGIGAGLLAFHSGPGVLGSIIIGLIAAAVTLYAGQLAFAVVRSPLIRAMIALLFAIPATIAGYHTSLRLAHIGVPSQGWREVFAWIGALFIGGTAWTRMTVFAEPLPLRPGGSSQNNSQPFLTGATRQG